jgi:peptide/nickel transport system substrate-binding protein
MTTQTDFARTPQLYETANVRDPDFVIHQSLATEIVADDPQAKVWTVRLRDGVEFHNGKPLSADDLIFTMQRVFKLPYAPPRVPFQGAVNPKNSMKKLDSKTVRFTLERPWSLFKQGLLGLNIVPVGYNPAKPVGTGPFMFKAFTPGTSSTFVRNPNWWGGYTQIKGAPFFDTLSMLDVGDDTARVNGLLAGQLNAIQAVPAGQMPVISANSQMKLLVSHGGLWRPFTMRVDLPPYSDNRIRQAIRLIANREQMVTQALAGQGRVANDLYSPWDPAFASDIPQRQHDPEQAKSLLKQAGHEGLTVQLTTSAVQGGVVEASQVLASNAGEAGMTINLRQVDSGTFYGSNYLKWPFAVDWWGTDGWLYQCATSDGPVSQWNETHWHDPTFDKLFSEVLAQPDETKQKPLIHQMQEIQWNRGGYIIWAYPYTINAHQSKVQGFVPTKSGDDFTNWELSRGWFA